MSDFVRYDWNKSSIKAGALSGVWINGKGKHLMNLTDMAVSKAKEKTLDYRMTDGKGLYPDVSFPEARTLHAEAHSPGHMGYYRYLGSGME